MKKEYLIFDLDGTLIESMSDSLKLGLNYLSKIPNTDIEKAKYIFSTTMGMALKKQLELVYEGVENINIDKITEDIYKLLSKHDADFFEGVPEKIKELSNKYKLFLTTGNTTETAKKYLKKGDIINNFELIYGSDIIHKGREHLEIFKNYTNDPDFYKKSIYIGDGDGDREFAKEFNIDFIHIGNSKIDKYEIDSVKNIDKILELINNK